MNRRRTFNICLTVVITAAFILLGAFVFGDSYLRFGETAKDFGLSVGYYFCTLFGLDHDIVPSVTEYSSVMDWSILLPSDFEGFTSQATSFFSLLVDGENFCGLLGEGRRCDARTSESRGNHASVPAHFGAGHLAAVQERQHQAQQGHRTAESVQIIFAVSVSAVETDCIVVSGLSYGASCGMDPSGR